jgi:hypothetical protein
VILACDFLKPGLGGHTADVVAKFFRKYRARRRVFA